VQFVEDRTLQVVGKRIDRVERATKLPISGPDSSSIELIRAMLEVTSGKDLWTSSYIGGGTISEACCRILYFDPLSEPFSFENDAMNFEKGRSALWELLALRISHFRSLQDTYETCPTGSALSLDLQVYNRSLIMSEEGYIGLAPDMVETGDELCIFLGCGAPMLACFQFIGESYVVGLTWGEGFLGPIAQDWVPASRFSADGRDAQSFLILYAGRTLNVIQGLKIHPMGGRPSDTTKKNFTTSTDTSTPARRHGLIPD